VSGRSRLSLETAIPRGIFIDTSVLLLISEHGGYLFDGDDVPPDLSEQLELELLALQDLLMIDRRAHLPFMIDKHVAAEAQSVGPWLMEFWSYCAETQESYHIDHRRALPATAWSWAHGNDRAILRAAHAIGAAAVLTNDGWLLRTRQRERLAQLGLLVLDPVGLWERVAPWAHLW
jgi:hypothetical protein